MPAGETQNPKTKLRLVDKDVRYVCQPNDPIFQCHSFKYFGYEKTNLPATYCDDSNISS